MPVSASVDTRIRPIWTRKAIWRLAVVAFLVVLVLLSSRFLPLREWMERFTFWTGDLGITGMLLFGIAYVIATILCFWGAVFSIGAGVGFGLWLGILISWVSASIGASLAFLIARYLARGLIARWAEQSVKTRAMDDAIGEQGWKIVLLLRLNPIIPFNLSNYAFGLTRIGFWPYLLATAIGMLPGTVLYAYLGHVGKQTLVRGMSGPWYYTGLAVGLVLLAGATAYLVWLAKRALPEATDENAMPPEPETSS